MNRIRLLSEQVANQIAAGEVVERPASVVKELVENALDAQATRLTVEVQAGGRSLIRVTDDGVGMSKDDALLCLERHATSKIRSADDLTHIQSMGFRGEAVPSIASVSRMTLTTRERDGGHESGTQVIVHGGRILEVKEAGSAPGSCFEVRNLFFNLPARRKFLRSEETERAHIQHYLSLAALAYPEVALTFLDDQRVVWQLPQVKRDPARPVDLAALRERLRELYGAELELVDLNVCEEGDGSGPSTRLWGFIGAPGVSRATRDEQHLFVNRRPIENRGLNFALLEGCHTTLMKGRYPVCCLFLEIDPAAVDVNIHPTKREVKFHQEFQVRRFVTAAVRQAILSYHGRSAPVAGMDSQSKAPSALGVSTRPDAPVRSDPEPQTPSDRPSAAPMDLTDWQPVRPAVQPGPAPEPAPTVSTPGVSAPAPFASSPAWPARSPAPSVMPEPAKLPIGQPTPLLQVPLRLLGVIGDLYLVLESDRGLVLLDQHAAHERILFEQMLRRLEQGSAPSQRLLLPETIELAPREAQFLREQLATLTRLGVGLSEFGDRTFLLDALPPFVRVANARRFVLELVDELKAVGDTVNPLRLAEQTVAKTVCRHAVKAHDPLTSAEMQSLVKDLRQCAMPYTCPHGRPTLIEMSFRELEKKFGRAP